MLYQFFPPGCHRMNMRVGFVRVTQHHLSRRLSQRRDRVVNPYFHQHRQRFRLGDGIADA